MAVLFITTLLKTVCWKRLPSSGPSKLWKRNFTELVCSFEAASRRQLCFAVSMLACIVFVSQTSLFFRIHISASLYFNPEYHIYKCYKNTISNDRNC